MYFFSSLCLLLVLTAFYFVWLTMKLVVCDILFRVLHAGEHDDTCIKSRSSFLTILPTQRRVGQGHIPGALSANVVTHTIVEHHVGTLCDIGAEIGNGNLRVLVIKWESWLHLFIDTSVCKSMMTERISVLFTVESHSRQLPSFGVFVRMTEEDPVEGPSIGIIQYHRRQHPCLGAVVIKNHSGGFSHMIILLKWHSWQRLTVRARTRIVCVCFFVFTIQIGYWVIVWLAGLRC